MNEFLISVVVPSYNEEENILPLVIRVQNALRPYDYEIILINDGSDDHTQQSIDLALLQGQNIKYISFSRNFGHQAALKAGIDHAKGDCIVTMDADLQKPPETIPGMIELWQKGFDIVTATCQNNGQASLLKRLTSTGYYWLLSKLADQDMVANGADFRLFDKKNWGNYP